MAKSKSGGSSEVAVVRETNPALQDSSAERLIQQAITAGTSVDVMERLLAMRSQLRAEQAKEAFDRAMAQFQAECPTITKTKEVNTRSGQVAYKYAPIESIVAQVKEALKNNGFSYKTQVDTLEKSVKTTVTVRHISGHSEDTSMEVPLGNKTDIMSNSQVTAAASTFAKRYAFCNAFGILTGDEDNDGATTDDYDHSPVPKNKIPTVTYDDPEDIVPQGVQAQRERIYSLLKSKGVDVSDRAACSRYVADETQLELAEGNFPAIIKALSK